MATVDNKHDIHESEPTNKLVDTLWRPQLVEILRFFYCSTSALGVSALFTVVIRKNYRAGGCRRAISYATGFSHS
jgi:hypothetical protein